MSNLLETASAWLDRQRELHLSNTVVYQRGADLVEVPATVGNTDFQVDSGDGILTQFQSRDYLIRKSVLMINGQPIQPRRGDRIQETRGQTTLVYEVMAPGGESPYRMDPYGGHYRIHTKQVETQ